MHFWYIVVAFLFVLSMLSWVAPRYAAEVVLGGLAGLFTRRFAKAVPLVEVHYCLQPRFQ
jgi:hypothetical protein